MTCDVQCDDFGFVRSVVKGDAPDYILGLFRCMCSDLSMSGCCDDGDSALMMMPTLLLLKLNRHYIPLSSVNSERPAISAPSPMYSEDDRCVHASDS